MWKPMTNDLVIGYRGEERIKSGLEYEAPTQKLVLFTWHQNTGTAQRIQLVCKISFIVKKRIWTGTVLRF